MVNLCRIAAALLEVHAPGVGPIIALSFAAAIDDPARFKSSKKVGAHFGLTPKKYQKRMIAGERVAELARELQVPEAHLYKWCGHFRRGGP